jgi:hypothetical protein
MPWPRHYRLAFGGPLFTTAEQWSCSLKLASPALQGGSGVNTEALIDDMAADVRGYLQASGNGWSGAAKCTWVKLNEIGPDGRYVNQATTTARYFEGAQAMAVATGNGYSYPQAALAVTLTSARSRGPLSKGRFFIPAGWYPQSATDPTITTAQATSAATAAKNFLAALNNMAGVDTNGLRVVLVSQGGRGLPEGGLESVTGVSVGRLVDTQQRRRRGFTEMPVKVAL